MLPAVKVPVYASQDATQGKRGARKRERRVRELWKASNWSELATKNGADYSGAGFTILGVWANFGEEDLSKRNPYVQHFDPRHTYILKDELGNITEMLVALLEGARRRVLIQSPYLVLSDRAEELFDRLHEQRPELQVQISTNSLATTDSWTTYGMYFCLSRANPRWTLSFFEGIHNRCPSGAKVGEPR